MASNGSGNVLRHRREISINPESKKDGEIDSESIISEFFNDQSVFKPDVIKWKEPEKPTEKPEEKPKEKLKEQPKKKQERPKPEPAPERRPRRRRTNLPMPPMPQELEKDDQIDLESTSSDLHKFYGRSKSYPSCYPPSSLQNEKNASEHIKNFQESSDPYHLEWIFIITNLVLEILLVVLDQMASPQKPGYALTALAVSTIAISVSLFELYLKAGREGVGFKREGLRFRFDSSTQKQFYNFIDVFGLICAVSQFIFSVVAYSYHRRHADSPVNISIVSLIFIICLAFSKLRKNRQV